MATTNGPDLTTAVEAVEALMDDACRITRDSKALPKLDVKSGNVIQPVPQTIVENHPCSVRFQGAYPQRGDGEEDVVDGDYQISFPISTTPVLLSGDVVEITSTRRDPDLVGRTFRIQAVYRKTFAVSRKVSAVSLERV